MSHNNNEEIELYKKHKQECEQHILMDMVKIFNIDDMVYATVWKLMCDAIYKDVPKDKRKEYILEALDKQINKWI